MNLNEEIFDIPTEHMANVFGGCDKNIKKIERALHVTIAVREGGMRSLEKQQMSRVHHEYLWS